MTMQNSRARLVVLISGSGSNLQSIMDACSRGELEAEVALVVSNRDDAYGLQRARDAGIATAVVANAEFTNRAQFEDRLASTVDTVDPDFIVLAGFMRILSPSFVERYADKILNIHPSLLPDYKGTDTHRRVIEAGEAEHGASVHLVTADLDGGPIIQQTRVAVQPDDTPESLAARVLEKEHALYPNALQRLIDGRVIVREGQLEFRDNP